MQNRRQLTTREAAVVERVSQGLSNAEIACGLGVSLATVKRHLNSIMIKWNCNNRTQVAVRAALQAVGVAEATPLSDGEQEAAAGADANRARAA